MPDSDCVQDRAICQSDLWPAPHGCQGSSVNMRLGATRSLIISLGYRRLSDPPFYLRFSVHHGVWAEKRPAGGINEAYTERLNLLETYLQSCLRKTRRRVTWSVCTEGTAWCDISRTLSQYPFIFNALLCQKRHRCYVACATYSASVSNSRIIDRLILYSAFSLAKISIRSS